MHAAEPAYLIQLPQPLPLHPRLLAKVDDWGRIVQQIKSDPVSARIFSALVMKATEALSLPLLERKMIGCRLLYVSRFALERISLLAMVAQINKDPKLARRAIEEMVNVAKFSDWNPPHYLDVAEMSLALAIGYDWLHQYLSTDERDLIAGALLEKGIKPSLGEPEQGFIKGSNNWNQVCHAGLLAAAIAIADRSPEISLLILRRAVKNLSNAAHAYSPDGAFPEGPMYWIYGTSFHVVIAAALQRFTGSTQGTDAYAGFKESADYVTQMTRPDGYFYSYSDCRAARHLLVPLFWFASHYGRPDWLRDDIAQVDSYMTFYETMAYDDENYRLLSLALLWRDPSLKEDFSKRPALHWFADGIVPVSVHRSSFGDPNALYAAIKGGSPSVSHGHMDIGSFYLESDAVVWATDLGMQEYDSLESVDVNLWDSSENGTRWKIFRLGPEGHNILRFNGEHQLLKAKARIVRFQKEGPTPHSIVDLGPIYEGQVKSVRRGLMFVENRTVLIQDEWKAGDNPVEVTWQMLTGASVTIEPGFIHLCQNGKIMNLQILDNPRIEVEAIDTALLQKPYDAPNSGIKRITIKSWTKAGENGGLRLFAVPNAGRGVPSPEFKALNDWS